MTDTGLRIGTAGWNVSSRTVTIAPGGSHLERYARHFNAVEINSLFHRPHQRKTYERWAGATPPDFRFSVKVSKAITHDQRFVDCDALLDRFAAEVTGLSDKLAILLVQLPPKFAFDENIAGRFFRDLRARLPTPVALEPRHASWFAPDADEFLKQHAVARVAADPARINGAADPGGASGFAYFRWHGSPRIYYSDYDDAALTSLAARLADLRKCNTPAWCIFDNTASSAALGNALTLQNMLAP